MKYLTMYQNYTEIHGASQAAVKSLAPRVTCSGGASAGQKTQNSKHRPLTPFHNQNKTNKAVRYGNIVIFCSHYYRSKAIHRARQGRARARAREVDLPARSFDLVRPGVAPPLDMCSLHRGSLRSHGIRR